MNLDTLTAQAAKAQSAVEAARAAIAAEQQRQQDTIAEAQAAWRRAVVAGGKSWDLDLEQRARTAYEAAEEALRAGDLSAAFAHFMQYKAANSARYVTRTDVQNAAGGLGVEPYTNAMYTDRSAGWDDFLTRVAEVVASSNGVILAAEITGEPPTDLASAEAYLKGANRG